MQGEIYTEQAHGTKGHLDDSIDKLLSEQPEYFIFNGSADALKKNPLKVKFGETVRIYFGMGAPNYTLSFHVIGENFDKAYPLASLSRQLRSGRQYPKPGGARTRRNPAGGGPENPTIFKDHNPAESAMSTSGH